MEQLLLIIIGILLLLVLALLAKVYFLRKSAQEIAEAFRDRLKADTNTLIDISSRDPYMRRLAAEINTQLRILRKEHHRYTQGDLELKEAVTNISHDLRTPLTAICGYLDILDETEDIHQIRRCLAIIRERTDAMKSLTEELFRYSIVNSAVEKLTLELTSLNDLLETSLAAFYSVLTERGITPQITMPEQPVLRQLDRTAMRRVLSNILSNAVKYSDGDLVVTLTEKGTLTFENSARHLTDLDAQRLFHRFYTVESAGSSTGLGLAIAKQLTEKMGGSICAGVCDGRLTVRLEFLETK